MTATIEQPPAEPTAAPDERLAYRGPIQRLLTRPEIGAFIGAAVIWAFFWAVSDIFGTTAGANNYLDVATSLGIMAVAVALLMIGGEFDLSAGAMTGATGMLLVLLVKDTGEFGGAGLPLLVALPITLAFALGVGLLNGTLVERTGLPSFIVTLGTFFVLVGAKLGFAKLFTDKVIVEGLDNAPDFDVFKTLFGSVWIRNDHVWDSFLGGRDLVFAVLAIAGAVALTAGVLELSLVRKASPQSAGIPFLIAGLVAAVGGVVFMSGTDSVSSNWIGSILVGVGSIIAAIGFAHWRYEPRNTQGLSLAVTAPTIRRVVLGVGLIVLGIVAGVSLDSSSQTEIGFLLTVQGLRALLFMGLVTAGMILVIGAARAAQASPVTQLAVSVLAAALLVVVAFVVQSEGDSRKIRAEMFAAILILALMLLVAAIVRYSYVVRRYQDPPADQLGRVLALSGIGLMVVAVSLRLLWSTTEENAASTGTISYRISVLYFLAFAVVATWLLLKTRFGSWTFAVGGNAPAARQVGVPAARTKTRLFMLVSASAWLVGTLIAFRLNSVQANVGDGNEFLYIIAAVVGGCLLTGGYGSAAGAAIGAVIMAMSFQGIPFSGWNSDWRFLFVGVILLLAVLVNNYVRSRAEAAR